MAQKLPLFIGGEFVASETNEWLPVTNPATQEVLGDVPFATQHEVDRRSRERKGCVSRPGGTCRRRSALA